ncbi:MAG: ABC transporter permease subunit [Chloroflexi bacterium]|nr:ABC transporter permease subunit [Chloroflexota bacterium]
MAAKALVLARWEWFKLRRRWMPWILLAIALVFSQLAVWGPYFAYQQQKNNGPMLRSTMGLGAIGPDGKEVRYQFNCKQILEGDTSALPPGAAPSMMEDFRANCRQLATQYEQALEETKRNFTLPVSIPAALAVAGSFSIILIAIMTSSLVGSDYGWGTLRTVLARGAGRSQYLAAKLALMAAGALGLMLMVALATMVSSSIAGAMAGAGGFAFFEMGFLKNLTLDIGRAWIALWPFIALSSLVAILARSTVAGMAAAIGYYFAEIIASGILLNVVDWFKNMADYMLVRNISAWMQGMRLGGPREGVQVEVGVSFSQYPSEWHALLVLAAYTVALTVLAFWVFQRRDVAGSGGGG